MLPKMSEKDLQNTISCLVQGGSDITLMGAKSSGKTTLMKRVMKKVFDDNYVYLNCTIVDSRQNFLFLLTFEMIGLFKKLSSKFMNSNSGYGQKYSEPGSNITLSMWIKDLKKMSIQFQKQFQKIERVHILVDNIQEIRLSQNFMNSFYTACRQQIKCLKLSFSFVGTNIYTRSFDLDKPFSIVPVFYMPKPDIRKVIKHEINQFFKKQQSKGNSLQQLKNHLQNMIFHSFQTIQSSYDKIKQITKIVLDETKKCHKKDFKQIKIWMNENGTKVFDRIKKYGPVAIQNIQQQEIDKEIGRGKISKFEEQLHFQNYPSLILTSIYLANGHPENTDYKRFKDYKQRNKSRRDKNIGKTIHRKGEKNARHNIQRIVAISQILQDLSKEQGKNQKVPFLMEKDLDHHSLDYYGCFEYLREENQISYYGKVNKAFGGKLYGTCKEDQARQFFRKMTDGGISINQFIQ